MADFIYCIRMLIFVLFVTSFLHKMNSEPVFMVYDRTKLHIVTENTQNMTDVINTKNLVCFDYLERSIFWSDSSESSSHSSIKQTNIDTKTIAGLTGTESVSGLAVDWIGLNIYWTSVEDKSISVCKSNGKYRTSLYWEKLDYPQHIVLDPLFGYLFYTNHGKDPSIVCTSMAGEASTTRNIVSKYIGALGGLSVDLSTNKIYWTDTSLGRIESCDYNGANRLVVVQGLSNPVDIDIYNGEIYWLDGFKLFSSVVRDTKDHKTHFSSLNILKMKIFKEIPKINGTDTRYSLCTKTSGTSCSQLCLISSLFPFYRCVCAARYSLMGDNSTCKKNELPVLLLQIDKGGLKLLNQSGVISLNTGDIIDSVMLTETSIIYIPKSGSNVLSINFDWFNTTQRVAEMPEPIYGLMLAYDWIGKNIYFMAIYSRTIIVMKHGKLFSTFKFKPPNLIKDGFVIDSFYRYLFWAGLYTIEKIGIDGSSNTYKVIKDHGSERYYFRQKPFTLDIPNQIIYEYYGYTLYKYNYDGKESQVVVEGRSFDFIVTSEKYLFYVDIWKNTIMACDKVSGRNCMEVYKQADITGLLVYHRENQNIGKNDSSPCEVVDRGCSHLCVLSPLPPHYRCICYDGYDIMEDKQTCDINECLIGPDVCPGGKCINTIGSYTCKCENGFTFNSLNGNCQDINECHILPDLCYGKLCVNTIGSYTCECPEEKYWNVYSNTCQETKSYGLLLCSPTKILHIIDIWTHQHTTVITTDGIVLRGLDFDPSSRYIYYIGNRVVYGDNIIERISLDHPEGKITLIEKLSSSTYGLVIDPKRHKMYWVNPDIGLMSAYLTGAGQSVIFEMQLIRNINLGDIYNDHFVYQQNQVLQMDPVNGFICLKLQNGSIWYFRLDPLTHSIITHDSHIVAMGFSDEISALYLLLQNGTKIMAMNPNGTIFPFELNLEKTRLFSNFVIFRKDILLVSSVGEIWSQRLDKSDKPQLIYRDARFETLNYFDIKAIPTTMQHDLDYCYGDEDICLPICTCLTLHNNSSCLCSNGTLVSNLQGTSDLFIYNGTVLTQNVDGPAQREITEIHTMCCFDFTHDQKLIYMVDQVHKTIKIFSMDGYEDVLVMEPHEEPVCLAVDWISGNLYWTDKKQRSIVVSDTTGKYRKSLYWKNIENPSILMVDSDERYLFWLDKGQTSRIERGDTGNHDPKFRKVVVSPVRKSSVFTFTLDFITKKLYWVSDSIYSCDYDGHRVITVLKQNGQHILESITVKNGLLMWVDNWRLFSMNIKDTEQTEVFMYNNPFSLTVKFIPPASLKDATNHCNKALSRCSHLCLLSREYPYYTCACSHGYSLVNDTYCEMNRKEMLILATKKGIYLHTNSSLTKISDTITNKLSLNYDKTTLYYTNNIESSIVALTLEGNELYRIAMDYGSSIKTSLLDTIGSNLYVHFMDGTVRVYSVDRSGYKTFPLGRHLLQLLSDPRKGLLFLVEQGRLSKTDMSFNNIVMIIQLDSSTPRISVGVDIYESRIYISESGNLLQYDYHGYLHKKSLFMRNQLCLYVGKNVVFFLYVSDLHLFHSTNYGNVLVCDKYSLVNCQVLVKKIYYQDIIVFEESQTGIENDHSCKNSSVNCQHICLPKSYIPYYICTCFDGHELLGDNESCAKIPCAVHNDGCSHICIPSYNNRSSMCACERNLTLSRDGKTCIYTSSDVILVLIQTEKIQYIYIEPHTYFIKDCHPENGRISKSEYDPVERNIYYSIYNNNGYVAKKTKVGETDKDKMRKIELPAESMANFVLDWMNRRFIWIHNSSLRSCDLNGSNVMTVKQHIQGVYKITSQLHIDVFNGVLFWINDLGQIVQMTTSGINLNILPNELFVTKILAVDPLHQKLYIQIDSANFTNKEMTFVLNIDGTNDGFYFKRKLQTFNIIGNYGYYIHTSRNGNTSIQAEIMDSVYTLDYYNNTLTDMVYSHLKDRSITFPSAEVIDLHIVLYKKEADDSMDSKCAEIAKCLDWFGKWICLKAAMICDGIGNCYGHHDEIYCSKMKRIDVISQLKLSCLKNDNLKDSSNSYSQKQMKNASEFLSWFDHPFSYFISIYDFIHSDCSVLIKGDSNLNDTTKTGVTSLTHIFQLRQISLATLNLRFQTVRELIISGRSFLKSLSIQTFETFTGLRHVSLINTGISFLPSSAFKFLLNLKDLIMINNTNLNILGFETFKGLFNLTSLKIYGSNISNIDGSQFTDLVNLQVLNLSHNNIELVDKDLFVNLLKLRILDISHNNIKLTSKFLFYRNFNLKILHSDSFHFCCMINVDNMDSSSCSSPKDTISNCQNMIGIRPIYYLLWIFCVLSIAVGFLVLFSCFYKSTKSSPEFNIIFSSFLISDFLTIVIIIYLAVIDIVYQGDYFMKDLNWKNSSLCLLFKLIFLLCLLSSLHVSVLISVKHFCDVVSRNYMCILSKNTLPLVICMIWVCSYILVYILVILNNDIYYQTQLCVPVLLTVQVLNGEFLIFQVLFIYNASISAIILILQFVIFIITTFKHEKENAQERRKISLVAIGNAIMWILIGVLVLSFTVGLSVDQTAMTCVILVGFPVKFIIDQAIYLL